MCVHVFYCLAYTEVRGYGHSIHRISRERRCNLAWVLKQRSWSAQLLVILSYLCSTVEQKELCLVSIISLEEKYCTLCSCNIQRIFDAKWIAHFLPWRRREQQCSYLQCQKLSIGRDLALERHHLGFNTYTGD